MARARGARTSAPMALADPVRTILRDVNPNVPITRINSADDVVARSMTEPRLYTFLLGAFALLAVALAAIGLYGLYLVFGVAANARNRRPRRAGRLALGHRPARPCTRRGARGSRIGYRSGSGLAATRALVGLIKGVQPNDPVTLVAVTSVLLGIAMLASYVPARRAARVDPITALRAE